MFKKILIANRGEIACRIIRTAHKMGIQCVAVYSDADRNARHVRMADEAVHIGASPSSESYLKADVILQAAKDTGAEAIHPGYGFLSENAEFSAACKKAKITFIGPSAKSITAMGLKDGAKEIMESAGVPIVPGYQGQTQEPDFLKARADEIGYPVLIKAVAGGGGKGMRLVEDEKDFKDLLGNCQREGKASFGNDHVLIEKYITKPRHIEVQVFGDTHGNVIHLFERDCSLQRRHQKVVEEAPAPGISATMRANMGDAAVKAAQAIDYHGAGTIEFIVDCETGKFYFMEMNTRLQVEHPVTEYITGQDLVEWQLRVAAGEELPLQQKDLQIDGHAFEVRLYAEDPAENFMPQTGKVQHFSFPKTDSSIRIDSGIETGDSVTSYYDPMIAKLITHGASREEAAMKMKTLLRDTYLSGLNTNQEFLYNIFTHEIFMDGDVDTGFIPRHEERLIPDTYGQVLPEDIAILALHQFTGNTNKQDPWASHMNWRMGTHIRKKLEFTNRGTRYEIACSIQGNEISFDFEDQNITAKLLHKSGHEILSITNGQKIKCGVVEHKNALTLMQNGRVISVLLASHDAQDDIQGTGRIVTNMPGRIVNILVKKGEEVEKDQPLLIMESMKVEITIRAGVAGIIDDLPIAVNDQVADGALLVNIEPA
ncbi:MAG: acetyl/propionyl/methylcrotonyl-CoA carboxylase subunit alpha [Alphaproteobacteria bacterium]